MKIFTLLLLLIAVSDLFADTSGFNKYCFLTSTARTPRYICDYLGAPRFVKANTFDNWATFWEISSGTLCITSNEEQDEFTTYEIQVWSEKEKESQKTIYSERWDIPLIIGKDDKIKNSEESLKLHISAACLNFAAQEEMTFTLDKKTNKGVIRTKKFESGKCFGKPAYDQEFEVSCKKIN